jgi:peptidoglycan/xylan/chitin deacetylase (PgdA/CDA1 family)
MGPPAPGSPLDVSGLALTFDDGPDPEWTGRLLDLLASRGARATFFPMADRAAAAPHLIERMLDDGHEIGLHCFEHVRHSHRDAAWLRQDTIQALARLASVGVHPTLWRAPWGDTAAWSADVAAEHGLRLVGWSVDTHDWRGDSAEAMLAATRPALAPGAIVLAHDGIGPGARRQTSEQTLRYVAAVADLAESRGLALEPLELGAVA